ncbi:divalent-cation tolerance protein CutA [Thalassotalea litorea]|uniref:Divalent-cation tolerance protein CutA n=1 Tax=Thalassotalea litorea TaxID=2020715 RepID=A0A5R9IP81_9GAMM|nr:divalent-cation tolerance protein CutA [Thalassotalea litorea]TLU67082.1 divalent-cation tolerance protein CutA [Thalassotalea litorea]
MYQIILCTCPDKNSALTIANALVDEQLAACVNIQDSVTSVYQWQGERQQDQEVMMIIKSTHSLFAAIEERITALHPYDVAEIIALDIQQGNEAYLNWIDSMVTKQ